MILNKLGFTLFDMLNISGGSCLKCCGIDELWFPACDSVCANGPRLATRAMDARSLCPFLSSLCGVFIQLLKLTLTSFQKAAFHTPVRLTSTSEWNVEALKHVSKE